MKKVVEFLLRMEIGGAQDIVKKYAFYLDKEMYDVTVLVYTPKTGSAFEKELEENHIKVIYIGELIKIRTKKQGLVLRIERQTRSMLKLYSVLNQIRPHILHIHSELFRAFSLMPIKRWKTKLVFTCHNEFDIIFKKKFNLLCAMFFCKRYGMKVIALSKKHYIEIAAAFGEERVEIIKNGIDIQKYKSIDRAGNPVIKQYGLDKKFVVGHVGRFSRAKNHPFIIRIFNELCRIREDAVLLLVGAGEEKRKIEELVETKKLTGKVIFLEDRLDIPEILNSMDVFLFPSFYEGIPLTLIEAQASGLICVVSDTIARDVIFTNQVTMLSLEQGIGDWVEAVLGHRVPEPCVDSFCEYDIHYCIEKLSRLYESL